MTKIVLLAAGKSTRSSIMKQLYRINGEYLINLQIRKLLSYGFDVLVVLGHNYKKIGSILDKNVATLYNRNYEEGMFSSVKSAFSLVHVDKFIFCHVDRPIADKETFEKLLKSTSPVGVAYCCHKKAPPILIDASMKNLILASKEKRLDYWIGSLKDVAYIAVNDKQIHFNANNDATLKKYFKIPSNLNF